eukprot:scaffold58301_cov42-Phaeocystis_antarctica.AAC.1
MGACEEHSHAQHVHEPFLHTQHPYFSTGRDVCVEDVVGRIGPARAAGSWPMRRMSLCVVVSSPPDDLRCYR